MVKKVERFNKDNKGKEQIKLDKTTAEQEIVRTIESLTSSLNSVGDERTKRELLAQIDDLKDQLLALRGPSYKELLEENQKLKQQLVEKEKIISGIIEQCKVSDLSMLLDYEKEKELKLKFYKFLLRKYSKVINEVEVKTVGELKSLINDDDFTVQSIVQQYKPSDYSFPEKYLDTLSKIYSFIVENVDYLPLDEDLKINFWMSPKEILSERISDDEDLAILLCSFAYSLGDHKAEVVVAELENLKTHAFVMTIIGENILILDPCQKADFKQYFGKRENVLSDYNFGGAKIKRFLYKFNRFSYEQFIE
ncbi:MAG: hypothetical protein N3D73_02210 [Candidatus Diapherotrites archaeon]|nr:hypothetical protein [Candidatus Diapherotrites archaeon]